MHKSVYEKMLAATMMSSFLLAPLDGAAANEPAVPADLKIVRAGAQRSSPGPTDYFTGKVRIDPVFQASDPRRTSGAYVTFEPGARTAWHTHPLGQTLVVTAGVGRVQLWEGRIEEIRPGDVVTIPPNTKHWHGAAPDSAMTHLGVTERLAGKTVDWLEKVSDAQYGKAAAAAATQPTPAQRMFGDIAPKFAELTDKVLYDDVWERAGLSKRDRSLVTVSALVALNRPDQLRSHLARARNNGLTQEELVEAIIHLAFYAGWPSGVTAINIAKEVFAKP
jgi:4-carboxymuconolactone decarboxylase